MGIAMVLISIYFFSFASKCETLGSIPKWWFLDPVEKSSRPDRFKTMLFVYRMAGTILAVWGVLNLVKFARSI